MGLWQEKQKRGVVLSLITIWKTSLLLAWELRERLEVKMGAECYFIETAKNRSLSCTKTVNGVDLTTCGAFLSFTLCSSTSSSSSTSLSASAVSCDVELHSVSRPKAACRLLVEPKRFLQTFRNWKSTQTSLTEAVSVFSEPRRGASNC